MYLGRFVEYGTREQVFSAPAHPYTQALLSAIPRPDPARARQDNRIILSADLPEIDVPAVRLSVPDTLLQGDRLAAPRRLPESAPRTAANHLTACHHATDAILIVQLRS